ncbi:hypothetical protein DEM27_01295 [Metarhizobium album]|uniref:Cellulose synthase n=1 Tax=Metarhizobium album TaxID=2182425 RepID=A0A2U2DXB2_9HYPH|nr:hypothetical protein [Rhizobium album]PWE57859.1 hypothetical protein DEM27_01295 [Rhizobium album]
MKHLSLKTAILLAATALAPMGASANDPLVPSGQPSLLSEEKPADAATAAPAAGPDEVDLAALYYYADQKQEDRVQAEIARLQLKYPGFQVPKNLYLPLAQRSVNEQSLWDLYDKNDFAGIDAEIGRLQAAHAGWVPSEDFSSKLERRKQRVTMTTATTAKDWTGVIAAGEGLDAATEPDIDLLWMLIDAYHATGMKEPLAEVCKGILFRQGDRRFSDDLLATTLQKAAADFSGEEIRAVINALWPQPGAVAALKPIQDDLLRREVATFTADDTKTQPLSDADIGRFNALAATAQGGADFAVLGWYNLKLGQLPAAETAFSAAMEREPTLDSAKGLYLSLSRQKRDADAYRFAVDHLDVLADDSTFLMNALSPRFSKPELGALDAGTVAAYSTAISETQAADHAEILGWYAYNSRQFEAAEAWFAKAWSWQEKPERLKGLALSYLREGKKKQFAALRDEQGDRFPELFKEIGKAAPPRGDRGVTVAKPSASTGDAGYIASLKVKRYDDCLRDLQRLDDRGGLSADAQLIRGWCLMGLARPSEAKSAFSAALQGGKASVRQDAAYGAALAALRSGLTGEAEAVIGAYPVGAARDREIRGEIYWQRARAAFDDKKFDQALEALNARLQLMPESSDMSVLRAWAHQRLGHKAEAHAIFQRLSMHLSDPNIMNGLNTTGATR